MFSLPRRAPALTVALVVLVLASAGLTLSAHRPPVRFGRSAAVSAVTRDAAAAAALRKSGWDHASVGAVDAQLERVSFYLRGKIVFEAALDPRASVRHAYVFSDRPVPYGNPLAFKPAVLIGLCCLFVLMAGVAPLRRRRNVDVLALLSFLAPVVLLQKRYIDASVITALPGLAYLAAGVRRSPCVPRVALPNPSRCIRSSQRPGRTGSGSGCYEFCLRRWSWSS